MARRVFHSFHYARDSHRVARIRNIGAIEGQPILSSNDWESVKRGGASAVEAWIDKQMTGKSCVVVLIGAHTAGRRWVNYEIEKGWNDGKGLVGVHIHNMKSLFGQQDPKGPNPFSGFKLGGDRSLSDVVKAYDPPFTDSRLVYQHIATNLESWVEEAIRIRMA